jgi:hypothetical protein
MHDTEDLWTYADSFLYLGLVPSERITYEPISKVTFDTLLGPIFMNLFLI